MGFSQDFDTKQKLCSDCLGELSLNISGTSFIKDNEYKSDFAKGFTAIGFFIKPELEYYLSPTTKLDFGIYLEMFSGTDKFQQVIPVFTIQQEIGKRMNLVLGSIYSSLSHGLEEPLYRFDNYYIDQIEYGSQLWYDYERLEFDAWLNWMQFTFPGDSKPEQIEGGFTSTYEIKNTGNFQISWPLQVLAFHRGGEINETDAAYFSVFNGDTGLNLDYIFQDLSSIRFQGLYFWYSGEVIKNQENLPDFYDSGWAYYLKLIYERKNFRARMGYWDAYNFFAPRGEAQFMSISESNPDVIQSSRQLLTLRLVYSYEFSDQVQIGARIDNYYDLKASVLDGSYGVYLLFKEDFFLAKNKRRRASMDF